MWKANNFRINQQIVKNDFSGRKTRESPQETVTENLSSFSENLINDTLMILTGKHLCFTEFTTKIHWNTRLAASGVFYILCNQLISFNSIIVEMSEKRDSSNRQKKWMVTSFSNFYGKIWFGICRNIRK